jgi:hypothetical protein
MRSLVTIFTAAAGIYMLLLLPAIAANCVPLTLLTAKSEATSLLRAKHFPPQEIRFVITGAARELNKLKSRRLGVQSQPCGIEWARAHILRCTTRGLPFLLSKTTKSLDAKTQVSGWGKAGLSVREAIFFGAFQMCLTTAKEVVFR